MAVTIATVEMPADELERLQADLASARAEVKRLRGGAPPDQELEKLRAERDHLAQQNTLMRDAANKLHRAEAENERLNRAVTVLVGERDTARAEVREMGNELAGVRKLADLTSLDQAAAAENLDATRRAHAGELAKVRRQLSDCEAALVEANGARRLSNAEHLHQRLAAASLVIARFRDWRYCPMCREIREPAIARHACGRLIPVDVIIARRPNPPTEEQP